MNKYTIITDSSCDLSAELAAELGVKAVPLSVFVDGKQYYNYLDGSDIEPEVFYNQISDGALVTTSAINMEQVKAVMEGELFMGNDVLFLAFSSSLSGTCNCIAQAAKQLLPRYPKRKIYVVDTLCASLGEGMLVYLAAKEKEKGKSIEEVRDFSEEYKHKICHWFTVNDLGQLKRGGRISGMTALVGSMLQIKPVLHMSKEGKLESMEKAKGRNASIKAIFNKMEETAIDPKSQTIFISHGDCIEDAEKLSKMVKDKYGCEVIINYIGPVIGAHAGKGTLAIFFIGTQR
jgi:DegV family protein with EDD domain